MDGFWVAPLHGFAIFVSVLGDLHDLLNSHDAATIGQHYIQISSLQSRIGHAKSIHLAVLANVPVNTMHAPDHQNSDLRELGTLFLHAERFRTNIGAMAN